MVTTTIEAMSTDSLLGPRNSLTRLQKSVIFSQISRHIARIEWDTTSNETMVWDHTCNCHWQYIVL